jgi:hypothetical protein
MNGIGGTKTLSVLTVERPTTNKKLNKGELYETTIHSTGGYRANGRWVFNSIGTSSTSQGNSDNGGHASSSNYDHHNNGSGADNNSGDNNNGAKRTNQQSRGMGQSGNVRKRRMGGVGKCLPR